MLVAFILFVCEKEFAGFEDTAGLFPDSYLQDDMNLCLKPTVIGADRDDATHGPLGSIRARYQTQRRFIQRRSTAIQADRMLTEFITAGCEYAPEVCLDCFHSMVCYSVA